MGGRESRRCRTKRTCSRGASSWVAQPPVGSVSIETESSSVNSGAMTRITVRPRRASSGTVISFRNAPSLGVTFPKSAVAPDCTHSSERSPQESGVRSFGVSLHASQSTPSTVIVSPRSAVGGDAVARGSAQAWPGVPGAGGVGAGDEQPTMTRAMKASAPAPRLPPVLDIDPREIACPQSPA